MKNMKYMKKSLNRNIIIYAPSCLLVQLQVKLGSIGNNLFLNGFRDKQYAFKTNFI